MTTEFLDNKSEGPQREASTPNIHVTVVLSVTLIPLYYYLQYGNYSLVMDDVAIVWCYCGSGDGRHHLRCRSES